MRLLRGVLKYSDDDCILFREISAAPRHFPEKIKFGDSPPGEHKNKIGSPTIVRNLHAHSQSRWQNKITDHVAGLLESLFRINSTAATDFCLQHQSPRDCHLLILPVSKISVQ